VVGRESEYLTCMRQSRPWHKKEWLPPVRRLGSQGMYFPHHHTGGVAMTIDDKAKNKANQAIGKV